MAIARVIGMPLIAIGGNMMPHLGTLSSSTVILDGVNEAYYMFGQIFTEDGGAHTLNTSGLSSIGWRSGAVTFSNAGTTVKVGLANIDTVNGPPGRAVNASNVVTFDVSADFVGGGGGISANAWNESIPTTGSKTVSHGDYIALSIQMTARGGTDSISVAAVAGGQASVPGTSVYTGASYSFGTRPPNAVITFSDGTLGYFYGSFVFATQVDVAYNNTTATREFGNVFVLPSGMEIYGLSVVCDFNTNCDLILYSDPLGTPVAERVYSLDLQTIGNSAIATTTNVMFSQPYTVKPNTPVAGIIKPQGSIDSSVESRQFADVTHRITAPLGNNCYAVSRGASGAFTEHNSGLDIASVSLLVGGFEYGVQPTCALGL